MAFMASFKVLHYKWSDLQQLKDISSQKTNRKLVVQEAIKSKKVLQHSKKAFT